MSYSEGSIEGRLLREEPVALAQVARWIAMVLTSARFYRLRGEWADLHQEALTRVIESLRAARFDSSRDFRSYVLALARYTAMEAVARRNRDMRHRPEDSRVEEAATDPEEAAVSRELVARILAIASDDCRHLFRLYFLLQKSYAEIAAGEGTPVGTVKSRLFRCLKAVQMALSQEGRA